MATVKVGTLEVEVVKKDIKNIHLGVYPPNGHIRLSAPKNSSDDKIKQFIITKIPWIRKNQRKFKNKERQSRREYINRESHYFEGKRYLLDILIDKNHNDTVSVIRKSVIQLQLRDLYTTEKRKLIIEKWMRKSLKNRLESFIIKWEKKLGVKSNYWSIKKMKTKWGSCNKESKRVWFNLELAKVDDTCLNYIVLHELAHLKYRNHGKNFITLMDSNMSNWSDIKEHLNTTILEYSGV